MEDLVEYEWAMEGMEKKVGPSAVVQSPQGTYSSLFDQLELLW